MPKHVADTSPSGKAREESRQEASIADARNGSPLGSSNTYRDAPNAAEPTEGTIERNVFNSHPGQPIPPGSTSDTGRLKP